MKTYQDIYSFVAAQENAMTTPITVEQGWNWNFKRHVKLTTLYKNSQLESGKNEGQLDEKPVKNITLPILRLQYRTEGFDVKDIEMFVDDSKNYYKSFLVKKFHTKWARENKIDTFIDKMVESYVDFGGALVKKTAKVVPEVVPMQSIAFCDQTDLLSGAFAIKHFFAPHELKEMAGVGWGNEANGATISLDDLIALSEDKVMPDKNEGFQNQTPSSYIELYEIHGSLPDTFLDSNAEPYSYSLQMHIVGFYTGSDNKKHGVTLYAKKEQELPFKLILRDEIHGRALGLGGAEELFEPQIWVNLSAIRMKEMLDAAAKIVYKTTDDNFASRNKMEDVDNGEILTLAEGKDIGQLDTTPRNLSAFQSDVAKWEFHAQQLGAAQDPIQGEPAKSGVPFRAQALAVQQSQGLHEYRRGKLSTFVDEIYQDWIIPHTVKEINKGQEFLAELDLDELNEVRERIVDNATNRMVKERILNGELILPDEIEAFRARTKEEFTKGGRRRFIKILKNEMKDAPVSIRISIAGKQENLSERVEKLVNVFGQILRTPQMLQDPNMAKLFNSIIENSGLSPIDFAGFAKSIPPSPALPTPPAVPTAPERPPMTAPIA